MDKLPYATPVAESDVFWTRLRKRRLLACIAGGVVVGLFVGMIGLANSTAGSESAVMGIASAIVIFGGGILFLLGLLCEWFAGIFR